MNRPYPKFFNHLCQAEIDFRTAVFKAVILDSSYTYSQAHEFKSSLTGILGTATMAGIVYPLGVVSATDTLVNSITGGANYRVVVYVDTGVAGTSPLFVFFDSGLNFTLTPSGDILVKWPQDATIGIFPMGGKLS